VGWDPLANRVNLDLRLADVAWRVRECHTCCRSTTSFWLLARNLRADSTALLPKIAQVPGLRWKIWLVNEAESHGGGIYLFDDEGSARAYLNGPIVAALKSSPVLSELTVNSFSVLEEPTAVTRGPIEDTSVRK
jgi:putative monooxygenase ydhR